MDNKSIDTSVEITPQNPFTIDIPTKEGQPETPVANPGFPVEEEKTGFFKSALDEFQENATNYHALHAASAPLTEPKSVYSTASYLYSDVNDKFYHPAPPGWSPKQEIEKQTNIDPKFIPKLLNTKNPDDFKFQLNDINEQTQRDKELQNGSTMGKILGGLVGLSPIGSIENFIPLTAIATKAKVANGFISGLVKNYPGILAASAIHEGAAEIDKVDGNLSSFLKDTFVDSAFGSIFFGAIGASKSLINVAEFNKLKQFSREALDGIGFNYKVDKEGNLKGFEAVDTTGSLSAARVSKAQEYADSAFYKSGLFKIPYVGAGSLALLSGNVPGFKYLLGSPLIRLKTSKYKEANAFADAAFDHFITTEGEAKGGIRPVSFEMKVKQTKAMLTNLRVQGIALHAESNNYKITPRPAIAIQNAWSSIKQKTIGQLSEESKSKDWQSKEDFHDKAQHVMISGISNKDAAVNEMAAMHRKVTTDAADAYLKAHDLPPDYLKDKDTFLSRVYNIPHMLENEVGPNGWVPILSNYYEEADNLITARMQPIKDLENQIDQHEPTHGKEKLIKLKNDLKYANEKLQNELRSNPEYQYHIEDRNALSSDEARELTAILKSRDKLQKQIEEQKILASSLKGKNNQETKKVALEKVEELKRNLEDEEYNLYDKARNHEINPRLYNPLDFKFRDPNNRLKFRDVYGSQVNRERVAKAQYDSITNMHPEDIIADMFGKITGNSATNPLKERTVLVPEELLYNNNFMTKDLDAKTANYVNFLSKRTHLKTSFQNTTVNGNFEELAVDMTNSYQNIRKKINDRLDKLTDPKEIKKEQKNLRKEAKEFNSIKHDMKTLFETRMMGINKRSDFDNMARNTLMSLTAAINLHNLGATQITDLAFGGYQHGIWPSVRDGIYPIIESLGGILKTKDSAALREMAPSIHLGLQDMGNNYADRNWNAELQPYVNMGKIVTGIEKYAHFSALADLSPYIDNGVQHVNGSIIQAEFMRLLHKSDKGTITDKEDLYLRKYGIDHKIWAPRMIQSYKDSGGFKTKLGGYMSNAWKWQDLEAANLFNDSVFRGINNTLVWKGMADSPFFADNILGMFFHTFTGWTYAATNRYLIPTLQHPDGEMLLKMMWMMGAGALVSPMRRISRGEDAVPDDMTTTQRAYEAFSDSGVFSSIGNVINLANLMTDHKFFGNLKGNDKFNNRTKTGIFGISDVVSSTASRISDVVDMANSGLDEKDMKTAANMLAITGSMYGHYASGKIIESWNLPRNKRAAENQ